MKTFISKSIFFNEVIKDLAKEFEISYKESSNVFSLNIPKAYGEGSIKGINFDEGIGLIIYDCLFKEDVEFQFIQKGVHPLKFIFCKSGSLLHHFQDSKESHEIIKFQNIVVASNQNKGHILKFKKNEQTKIYSLEIDRKQFLKSMSNEIKKLRPALKKLFKDKDGKNLFYYKDDFSIKTAEAFSKIIAFKGTDFHFNLLIHSKIYKILYIQTLEHWGLSANSNKKSILLRRELNLILEASNYIDNNLTEFRSVTQLAARVGLNPNKLQYGFKEAYGKTVNEYIQHARLMAASILIRNTEDTFSEIADKVGISSKSYFSKIFKDKYGLTPTEIRHNTR